MGTCGSQEAAALWSIPLGVLALAGMLVVGTPVLLVASVAAAVGLGLGLVVMPWLMPLSWLLLRRRRKLSERSGARRGSASAVGHRDEGSLTRIGRGPVPVH